MIQKVMLVRFSNMSLRRGSEMYDLKDVTGITCDSRQVQAGFLFAAIEGAVSDGNDYVDIAVQAGAIAILSAYDHVLPADIRLIKVCDPRRALAELAAQYYDYQQPETVVAVTGTNGKSSVVTFLEQLWLGEGLIAASLGTINAPLTSPDPVALHQKLTELKQQGVTHLALEASSHGLDQSRLAGVKIVAGAFTNLSHDHLDYHDDMDDYLRAKSLLFTDYVQENGVSVINADVPEAQNLTLKSRAPVISYGYQSDDIKLISVVPAVAKTRVKCSLFGEVYEVDVPLIGEFQIMNLLCAAGIFLSKCSSKEKCDRVIEMFKSIKPVSGRLQYVDGHPSGAQVYVDYAHTPDALETVLKSVRPHVKGKLFCVFGCGGDRDQGKRSLMGQIAANRSDTVIVTDDNPRNEKAVDIRTQILALTKKLGHNENVFEIGDRAAAIDFSIQQLQHDDCLIIAGKGHESYQILADRTIPFNDSKQAHDAIKRLKNNNAGATTSTMDK